MERFLQIARRFKLEGLLAADSDNEAIVKDDEIVHETIEENVKGLGPSVKHNPYEIAEKVVNKLVLDSSEYTNLEDLDLKIFETILKVHDGYQCKVCNVVKRQMGHMKEHVEIHFEGLIFPCTSCGKQFRTRCSLRKHTSKCLMK